MVIPVYLVVSLVNPDIKSYPVFRWTVQVRRGVTKPAAAARQSDAEMNETYGMSTSEGISQDNSAEIVILTYPWLCKSGYLIPTYPWICKS